MIELDIFTESVCLYGKTQTRCFYRIPKIIHPPFPKKLLFKSYNPTSFLD